MDRQMRQTAQHEGHQETRCHPEPAHGSFLTSWTAEEKPRADHMRVNAGPPAPQNGRRAFTAAARVPSSR
jgi:hypothetical protein